MLDPKQILKTALKIYNRKFKTQYLYIKELDSLYCGAGGREDLICSLIDLKGILYGDDYLVLDFGDDCNVYLFTDGFEFEGESPRSSFKQAI